MVFAPSEGVLGESLRGLAERGIPRAVIQAHVEGDLIKFYGIGSGGGADGGPQWFRWLYHKDQTVAGHPFDPVRLARLVRRAAGALSLEVYGGDAIATAAGDLVLLDLNAWPSFANRLRKKKESVTAINSLKRTPQGGSRRSHSRCA